MSTQVFSVRTDIDRVQKFREACQLLFSRSPKSVVETYMDYIIEAGEVYERTGVVKVGHVKLDSVHIVLDIHKGEQQLEMEFDYDKR